MTLPCFVVAKLVDEREYEARVLLHDPIDTRRRRLSIARREHLAKLPGGCGTRGVFGRTGTNKCLRDLIVEIESVRDYDERPRARDLAEDLSREEDHRVALARSLRVPEHAEPPGAFERVGTNRRSSGPERGQRSHALDRKVHPDELVVLREHLAEPLWVLFEQDKVLADVEQSALFVRASIWRAELIDYDKIPCNFHG